MANYISLDMDMPELARKLDEDCLTELINELGREFCQQNDPRPPLDIEELDDEGEAFIRAMYAQLPGVK